MITALVIGIVAIIAFGVGFVVGEASMTRMVVREFERRGIDIMDYRTTSPLRKHTCEYESEL